eukprot:GHUV01009021.1.p1 GENE.GHUV01009021.1~~GHUV01009021.1.p1  ORF type:complete len:136 (+),score=8.86 GHUV01009021.1:1165-1572(+)
MSVSPSHSAILCTTWDELDACSTCSQTLHIAAVAHAPDRVMTAWMLLHAVGVILQHMLAMHMSFVLYSGCAIVKWSVLHCCLGIRFSPFLSEFSWRCLYTGICTIRGMLQVGACCRSGDVLSGVMVLRSLIASRD